MKKIFKIITLLFLLSAKHSVIGQTYDFHNFSVEDGLAQAQVLSMCQDHNGNMWFGTNGGGASRYDGNKFTTYNENDSLSNNVVFSIAELKNQKLFFGTNGGLSVYDGKTFTKFTEKNGLPHSRVFKILQDHKGIVWIGTAKGVCQFLNNKIIPFDRDSLLNTSNVFAIYADKAGNIWFGTFGNGLIKYNVQQDKFQYYTEKKGLEGSLVRSINEDKTGNIFVGTTQGISKINTKGELEKVNIPKQDNLAFTDITVDTKNNLWLSTNEGVYKYNGFVFQKYFEKNGLPSNNIYCSYQDREGDLWFGTDGFGVSKFSGEAFFSYSTRDSLPSDYINSVFQDSKKNMWLGVRDFGVCKLQNNKIVNFKMGKNLGDRKISLVDNEVQAICEDNNNNIYFGTREGLSVYNGHSFQNFILEYGLPNDIIHPRTNYRLIENPLPENNIYAIHKDYKGVMWIGTLNGLCYMKDGKLIWIKELEKLKTKENAIHIYSIFEDESHNLWLATEYGVIKYDRKSCVKYSKTNGFTDKRVSSITQDKNGTLWFGADEGVFSYDFKTFKNINQNNGLAANKVYLMVLDNEGNLWAGTGKGIDKINLQTFDKNGTYEIKHFGKEDGLKGIECNRNAQFKSCDGNLWFGTIKGVAIYNPKHNKTNKQEALTHITGIRLFFQNAEKDLIKYSKSTDSIFHLPINLVLPYDKNHITFDFIGVCLSNPNSVKYKFKLEGADEDWFPPTSKTEATYSSLQAGDYTFHLKAMNNDGLWNKNDITFKFTVLPPWWKTWWFYSFVVLIIASSIYSYILIHTRNLTKAKIELEQEVELRTFQLRKEKEKVEIINKEVLEQKGIIETKNNDITDSIKYAKNIQEALLPPLKNIYNELNDAFVLYLPKDIVSGDFYWFGKRNNKRFIASVDCTGHGVPGAFMSIIGNTILNEIVTEKNITEPAEILNELHAGVKAALKQSNSESERRDGMDIALCSLNENGSVLEYAGANRPLWIFKKNKQGQGAFEMIRANKFPIGGLEMDNEIKRKFTNHSIPVDKGDMIYIFSDGYADQFGGPRGKKYMLGTMQKFIAEICDKPVNEQKKLLHKNFLDWKGELEQIDDVLVIGFQI